MALSEAQTAWLDFLSDPEIYANDIDAIGEPEIDGDGNAVCVFQDGKKMVEFKLIGEPPDRYESKILNPEDLD